MNYKSTKWRRKRASILRRDNYLCQEAKRYGKAVPATSVHHVYPVDTYPEYAWCAWNLVSLSTENHNHMHDKTTGALTEKGREWQTRIRPRDRMRYPPLV